MITAHAGRSSRPALPKAFPTAPCKPTTTNSAHPLFHCKGSHFRDMPLRYSPQLPSGMCAAAPHHPNPASPPIPPLPRLTAPSVFCDMSSRTMSIAATASLRSRPTPYPAPILPSRCVANTPPRPLVYPLAICISFIYTTITLLVSTRHPWAQTKDAARRQEPSFHCPSPDGGPASSPIPTQCTAARAVHNRRRLATTIVSESAPAADAQSGS